MTRATTKERERAILGVVYTAEEIARFTEGEQPDFTAPVPDDAGKTFGVEVTEVYLSESDARLKRLPGYLADLLVGKYRHAKDRKELPVDNVTITPHQGGDDFHTPAIIQRLPEVPEHLRRLAEVIIGKGQKAKSYKRLHHLNLVLVDRLGRWARLESGPLCKLLTSQHIPGAIWRTPFREVFYVTRLGERWVSVPLVMHCMMAELFGFVHITAPLVPEARNRFATVLQAFGQHLRRRSRGAVLSRGTGADYEVLHRRYGLLISKTSGVVLRDYLDFGYPAGTRELGSAVLLPLSNRALAQRLRRHHDSHSFECDIVAMAKAAPPW